jgi:hypothetical protein
MTKTDVGVLNPDEFLPPRDDEESLSIIRDWTREEEAQAKRKFVIIPPQAADGQRANLKLLYRLDFIIMPLLTLGFFCLRELRTSAAAVACPARDARN